MDGDFVSRDDAIKALIKNGLIDEDESDEDVIDEALRDNGLLTEDEYDSDEYLESFYDTYVTKSGEEVVAFGRYGTDN